MMCSDKASGGGLASAHLTFGATADKSERNLMRVAAPHPSLSEGPLTDRPQPALWIATWRARRRRRGQRLEVVESSWAADPAPFIGLLLMLVPEPAPG